MIALLTAYLFFCNPCALAEPHQQEPAQKLYSATLYLRGHNIEIEKIKDVAFLTPHLSSLKFWNFTSGWGRNGEVLRPATILAVTRVNTSLLKSCTTTTLEGHVFCISHLLFSFLFVWFKRFIPGFKPLRFLIQPEVNYTFQSDVSYPFFPNCILCSQEGPIN